MKAKDRIWFYPLIVMGLILILATGCEKDEGITDTDGNVYTSVTIGTQVWLVENLKTTKYQNGEQIPSDLSVNSTSGAYKSNASVYGNFYNAYVIADIRKICPSGWHVPSKAEWETLITFLGGEDYAGGKMKETGTAHWLDPNNLATNESGFTALAAGMTVGNDIEGVRLGTFWWSSTESDDHTSNYAFQLSYIAGYIVSYAHLKYAGFSIRCIKDN